MRLIARGYQGACLRCENQRRKGVVFVARSERLDLLWSEDIDARRFVRSHPDGGTSESIANALGTSLSTVVESEAKALAKLRELAKADPTVAEWLEVMLATMARRDAA